MAPSFGTEVYEETGDNLARRYLLVAVSQFIDSKNDEYLPIRVPTSRMKVAWGDRSETNHDRISLTNSTNS